MKINEVVKITGLTKKAIYYYEQEGLFSPKKEAENGYRTFSEDDLTKLLEISVLRRLDIPIIIIKKVIEEPNKLNDIMRTQLAVLGKRIESLSKNHEIIKGLINKFDPLDPTSIVNEFKNLNDQLFVSVRSDPGYMQHELERVFPGVFGKFLFIIYGPFLDEALDNNEKVKAWNELISELDALEETHYSQQFKMAVDHIYGNLNMDTLPAEFKDAVDKTISGVINPPSKEKLLESYKSIEYLKTDCLIFDEFLAPYKKGIFKDVDENMMILSKRFKEYKEGLNSLVEKMREMGLPKELGL